MPATSKVRISGSSVSAPEGAENGLQRPHPAQRVGRVGSPAPSHALRPGEAADQPRQEIRDDILRRPPRFFDHGRVEAALLGVLDHFGVVDRPEAGALEKTLDRTLGRADPRALALFPRVGLASRKTRDVEGKPARRREALRAFVSEAARHQGIGHEPLQVGRGLGLHAGRDLFGQQFEQKVGHRGSSWEGADVRRAGWDRDSAGGWRRPSKG